MKVIITKDYEQMSKRGAEIVIEAIKAKPDLVLGLATGSTPLGMYAEMIRAFRAGRVDLSKISSFNLDEYCGLPPDHPQSYHYYMYLNFFAHVNIDRGNVHIPNGVAEDLEEECRRYEEAIRRAGGIDLQVLGIGINGHIGFNEPGTEFNAETHVVELTKKTIEANSRFFRDESEVPRKAISMGIKTIMRSRRILLLASGSDKASAVAMAVKGPITPMLPASVIQLHPDTTVVLDKTAASLLLREYGETPDEEVSLVL